MAKLNVLLLVALVFSAVYLVRTSYESRRLFVELEREHAKASQLASDTDRLQIDRRDQATHLRVERVARERLGMRNPTAAVTQYVEEGASAVASVSAAAVPAVGGSSSGKAGVQP